MSVLPVVLISFKAILTASGQAELEWKTSEETNNAGFEIQKSTDAKTFAPIGRVDGAAESSNTKVYQFVDTDLQTTSYYRLKQMDFDGKFTLSRIVRVIPEKENANYLLAYPNPATDGVLKVRIPTKATSMLLSDKSGRIILKQTNPLNEQTIKLPYAGSFLLKVETEGGSKTLIVNNIRY
ncbi:T9SS type A sorting domain-containing protein [Dyadobacter sp. CY326]|uniref:T9SS type A sorting domain-containing protein n=1 Tax=Dyadobacter sp. CY326 TaxID=2907300 RepID=UPI001F32AB09|nr:T9SS type A sorting domain-containing protein [Dyadobacter sp. CY326]MCE7068114.1 T9SS type A sorting domain-containing protein [Dyadobacter sp. CY326]